MSKRLRFEVFKRDRFVCQYCGGQPPEVILVVDHIEPVAGGGANSIDNLITEVQVRPDADLMWLAVQQEIAEVRRFNDALSERREVQAEFLSHLQAAWYDEAGNGVDRHPADFVLLRLLGRFSLDVVEASVRVVAAKVGSGQLPLSRFVPYLWGVAKHREAGDFPGADHPSAPTLPAETIAAIESSSDAAEDDPYNDEPHVYLYPDDIGPSENDADPAVASLQDAWRYARGCEWTLEPSLVNELRLTYSDEAIVQAIGQVAYEVIEGAWGYSFVAARLPELLRWLVSHPNAEVS